MRIAIVHQAVSQTAGLDDQDVLVQAAAVEAALARLGHECRRVECTLDLETFRQQLISVEADLVFNLAESLAGHDSLAHLVSALLDTLPLRYSGNPTAALFLTNDKLLAKNHLRQAGLPTPDWRDAASRDPLTTPYIIKAVGQHASLGIDDGSVVFDERVDLAAELCRRSEILGRDCFAESYIDGREFNLSMLDGPEGPTTLPPAEIDFAAFPADMPRIVGFDGKWHADSFAYQNTPRRYDFPAADAPLLARLEQLAAECWRVFGLRGYVRVDFRVDRLGQPWILEINTNPCLSPDAGFAAALAEGGVSFDEAIERIIIAAMTVTARSGTVKARARLRHGLPTVPSR